MKTGLHPFQMGGGGGRGGHKEALTCFEWGGLQKVPDLRAPLHVIDNQPRRLVGLFV